MKLTIQVSPVMCQMHIIRQRTIYSFFGFLFSQKSGNLDNEAMEILTKESSLEKRILVFL